MTTRRQPLMDISNIDVTSSPVEAGKRRQSGRARRVPDKFVPEVQSSQPESANSKRKRGAGDAENDASDADEDAEASDATIESADDEEARKPRRKQKKTQKPAAKKPKVNGTTAHPKSHTIQLPNRSKRAAGRKVAIAARDVDGLYAAVYLSGKPSEDVATGWLDQFADDRAGAMKDMVNFVLQSAGCKLEVSIEDIDDPDNVNGRLGDLEDTYQAQNITEYPLTSKGKSVQDFRAALIGFFDNLLEIMHVKRILYDDLPLIENLEAWFIPMSSSSSRPFRHTATVVCLAMTGAMCRVSHDDINTSAQVQRQLESEKKSKRPNAARLAEFQRKVDTNNTNKDFIIDRIKGLYDSVFIHRYRDIDPKIRIECVEALGNWVLTFPSYFYEGQHLRYFGWLLSDSHGALRQEVIKQLQRIMKTLPTKQMSSFIEKFRERLVQMATRDSELGVRTSTVELLDIIREEQMLAPDDIDAIGKLIFDLEPRVRRAVADFFAATINESYESKVEDVGGEESLEEALGPEDGQDFDHPRASWITYKCLVESLVIYDGEDADGMPSQIDAPDMFSLGISASRFTLATDALYEKISELENWKALAGYLLFDHTSKVTGNETERGLRELLRPNESEELVLLEVLNATVKLNLTQVDDLDKTKSKQARAAKKEAKEAAARHLANLIPRLLKKFGANPQTATVVLRLEHVLNLDIFHDLRHDSTFYAKILDEISMQFNSHASRAVLTEASAALLHAKGSEQLEEVIEGKVQSLWDDAVSRLQKINKAGDLSVRGNLRKKVLTELSHTLARIEQLSSISNPVANLEDASGKGNSIPITILLNVIARGVYEDSTDVVLDELEDESVQSAIRSTMFYFMWKLCDLSKLMNAGNDVSDAEVDQLRDWQEMFVVNLVATFSSRSTLDPVRLLGAGTLLDIHVLFANHLRSPKPSKSNSTGDQYSYMQTLVKEIPAEVQQELISVFDLLEKQFAKKANKKLAEPDDDDEPQDLDSEPEDDEEEEGTSDEQRAVVLRAEKQLCELAGKLVLAIIAQVLDISKTSKSKLKSRIQRNRQTLGPNFKEIIAYLDEPKSKAKKSHKSKAQQEAAAKIKSAEIVIEEDEDEDEDEEDPFAEGEREEGSGGEEREGEMIEEEPDGRADENEDANGAAGNDDDEDDIMGD